MSSKNNEREYKVTFFPSSSTTEIMDRFTELDEHKNWLYDTMRLSFYRRYFLIGEDIYEIEFIIDSNISYGNIEDGYNNGITFSEMSKGNFSSFIWFLTEQFPTAESLLKNIKSDEDYFFKKPFLFRAQSSHYRGKGSTYGGTVNYGSTDSYAITGIKISKSYFWINSRKKNKYMRIYATE